MNIALLGFGTVGSHFYRLCEGRADLRVTHVLSRRARPELSCAVTSDFDAVLAGGADMVVEVMGGLEPAYSYVRAALRAGKHVVTANKQLMAAHYAELIALARENGVCLRCTAAAGGGIPWLPSLARAARSDGVTSLRGIMNGTTNFMLSEMTRHQASYQDALREAQARGYAEADPTADVEGLDARRKLVLSANIAFGVSIREEEIPCEGISQVTAEDIAMAKARGLTFRLLVRAAREGDALSAFVCPSVLPHHMLEAHTRGTENLISLTCARGGTLRFTGPGAGGWPTASNVLADCLEAARSGAPFYTDAAVPRAVDNSAGVHDWFCRRSGRYFTRQRLSAADAFAALEEDRKEDPHALVARWLDGDE